MPFSSPSICAKIIGIPSIFYDASGDIKINIDISHNVPTIRGIKELEGWFESLN